MRLRTRVLFGYWYLVALVIFSAGGAAIEFQRLGNNIDQVLTENFESVRASMDMVESLERQDSAVLGVLLGKDGARSAVRESQATFMRALERARANITIAEEVDIIDQIDERFSAFVDARDQLLDVAPERPLMAYEEDTFPRFEVVKAGVLDLLNVNHRAMVEADRQAQSAATRRATTLAVIVLVALLSLVLLSRAMKVMVLDRLSELTAIAEAIAGGSTTRRAADDHRDELGVVARQLNAMLDRQQQVRSGVEGRLALYRELLLGLLGAFPTSAALVAFDGRLVASTFDRDAEARLEAIGGLFPRTAGGNSDRDLVTASEAGSFHLEPLIGSEAKPIGWLATPAKEAGQVDL